MPACDKCNQNYGKLEDELLLKFGLCLSPGDHESLGIIEKAMRSIQPIYAKNEKDLRIRKGRRQKVKREAVNPAGMPFTSIFPEFGFNPNIDPNEQLAVLVPAEGLKVIGEKIVRGITWVVDRKYIEKSHEIAVHFLHNEAAGSFIEPILRYGQKYSIEPGVRVGRVVAVEDGLSALYVIEIWGRLRLYASVSPPKTKKQIQRSFCGGLPKAANTEKQCYERKQAKDLLMFDPLPEEIRKDLTRVAEGLSAPLFWDVRAVSSTVNFFANGTMCFLEIDDKKIGITADHVYQSYLEEKKKSGMVWCQICNSTIDLESCLIDRDKSLDIATFEIPSVLLSAAGLSAHKLTKGWPPPMPRPEDRTLIGGFPGVYRRDRGGTVDFQFSYLFTDVSSVNNSTIGYQFKFAADDPKPWASGEFENPNLGGISGGPVFLPVSDPIWSWAIVGIVCEYQQSLGILYARSISVLDLNGFIQRSAVLA